MYKQQVTTGVFVQDIYFVLATMAVVIAMLGLGFVDMGLSRRKNSLDQWIQKLVAGFSCAFGFIFVGYAIWQWQFNQAFGVKNAFITTIKQWWLGGPDFTHFAQTINPSSMPEVDVLQVFGGFFITFAFILGFFLQSSVLERMKPLALYISCFVIGAVVWPFLSYLVWGSLSPLTNAGLHDYTGVYNLYLFVGGWALVMGRRLKPRLGAFGPHPRADGPRPHNMPLVAAGVGLLLFAIPLIVLGSGYIVPGTGYFGISMTSSGFGVSFLNVLCSFIGGGIGGALLAYREKNPAWALLGPIAGYISCSALFDIAKPWEALIVSFFGPAALWITYHLLHRYGWDDPKIGPLTLGCGTFGALIAGFVGWGTKTGGYFGLTGTYGFQHAHINPGWQAIGVVVAVGFGAISALVLSFACEKTIGLRVSEEVEIIGLDGTYWPGSNEVALGVSGDGAAEARLVGDAQPVPEH